MSRLSSLPTDGPAALADCLPELFRPSDDCDAGSVHRFDVWLLIDSDHEVRRIYLSEREAKSYLQTHCRIRRALDGNDGELKITKSTAAAATH